MAYTESFKIIVAGNGGVGKTSFVKRFTSGIFSDSTKITLGVEFHAKTIKLNEKVYVKLRIWDFGGEDQFKFLLPSYVKGSHAAFFVFSITDPSSYFSLDEWANLLRSQDEKLPIILVGSKSDLNHMRKIQKNEGISMIDKENIVDYIEISSKTGQNVTEAYFKIAKYLFDNM